MQLNYTQPSVFMGIYKDVFSKVKLTLNEENFK